MNNFRQPRIYDAFCTVTKSPWFAYVTIALLQAKLMLWIWEYRDLTPGDASSYHMKSLSWLDYGAGDLIWSPIYTVFLAVLRSIINDPFWVTVVAQISIALSAAVLFLALLRHLLSDHIAWLVAAWWLALPINFDTVYNAHLFSALFPLALFVVAASNKTVLGRGIVLAGLLLTAILVRTEYLAIFFLWLIVSIAYEIYLSRSKSHSSGPKSFLVGYGLPMLITLLIIGGFYARAETRYPEIIEDINTKSSLYVCQNYAYNRKQQGDSWSGDPWTECQSLVERDFGQPEVTFPRAFLLNPRRVLEHVWWNIKLIPSGTQLAMFNRYAGGPNPDFMRAGQSSLVWWPFLVMLGLSLFAVIKNFILPVIGKRKDHVIRNRLTWLLMACTALSVVVVISMVRPRPSYMFPYTMFLMAMTGLGLQQLLDFLKLNKVIHLFIPHLAIIMIIFLPPYYTAGYVDPFGNQGQGWRELYTQVAPNVERGTMASPAELVIPAGNYQSLCNYLGMTCRSFDSTFNDNMKALHLSERENPPGGKTYVLYHSDMIWEFSSQRKRSSENGLGFVELHCSSVAGNIMQCSDGSVDLQRGIMNDKSVDIPLRAALFVDNGDVVNQMNYSNKEGYFLQVLMNRGRINMILVTDERMFRSAFNQQYLLGNFDRHLFDEVYNNYPTVRLLQAK